MSIQSPAKYEIHAIHLKLINYGNGIIDHASVYKEYCEVKSDSTFVHDEQRSGRASTGTDKLVAPRQLTL